MRKLALVALCLTLTGCSPVINQRGYLPDIDAEASVTVGQDTKASIQDKLGDPSMSATFNNDAWYYVSSVVKEVAFFTPTVEKRTILAVYFDKDGKVVDLKHYGLEDGHVVAFEARTTPARGRELTFLQQLFNAQPGVPGGFGQEQEQNPGTGPPPGP